MDALLILRVLGVTSLIFLPGAWISFGLPLRGLAFWTKLLMGVVLAPLVVAVEFYALRLLGAPFGFAAVLIAILNLPALVVILRQRSPFPRPDAFTVALVAVVLAIILASFAPLLLDPQKRLYTWEAWMHADIIYSLANGNLLLEDPELAGVTLSYPWAGHIFQGIFSFLLGTPPVTNYIWLNIVWLLAMYAFAAGIVAELGGNRLSQVAVIVWLSFGVNFVGFVLARTIPQSLAEAHHVLFYIEGDNRYTPWLDKVIAFSQMYFGMGLFIAIVFLAIRKWPDAHRLYYLILTGTLLTGLGILYSVLLPPAMAIVGARALLSIFDDFKSRSPHGWQTVLGYTVILAVAGLITLAQISYLSAGRNSASLVSFNDDHFRYYESILTIVITSPLLAGLFVAGVRCWRANRRAVLLLVLGGLVSGVLYVLFDIPWWRNEYKFVFTAAICLAAFPSVAVEPVLNRLGRWSLPAIALATIILALPFFEKTYTQADVYYFRPGPFAVTSRFDLTLGNQHPLSSLVKAIREKTPINSLLVLEDTTVHYPTLTQRQLYVAPKEATPQPGILVTSDEMLTLVKAYPPDMIEERRSTVRDLFDSNEPSLMGTSLERILAFGRPLALVFNEERQLPLREWLGAERIGRLLYQDDHNLLWLIEPGTKIPEVPGTSPNSNPIKSQP